MGKRSAVKKAGSFYISPLLIIMCAVFFAFGHFVTVFAYIASVLYHEFAHSVIAEKHGYKLNRFRLMPYGASVSGDYTCVKPKDEIIIAAAGPLSNFTVALLLTALWWLFPETYYFTEPIVFASFFVGFINLLPVFPLDGGRIFLAALSMNLSAKTASFVAKTVSITTDIIFIISAIALIFFGGNYSYITLAVFMLISAVIPDKEAGYGRLYSMAYASDRLKRGLPIKDIMVSGEKTLLELSKMLSRSHYTRFLIADNGFRVLKIITETELENEMMRREATEKVKIVADC